MAKKRPPKVCSWCGTKLQNDTCPRGPQCETDERDHQALMDRIKAEDAEKRRKPTYIESGGKK